MIINSDTSVSFTPENFPEFSFGAILRNGYIKIICDPGDPPIQTLKFRALVGSDAYSFDYIAIKYYDYNEPPIANAGLDRVVFNEVTLDGSASYDPDGMIVTFEWSLQHEDGSIITASGPNPTIPDLPPGLFVVYLTVTDDGVLADTDTMILAAAGQYPIPPVPDEDEDGVPDITDLCPDTPPDTEVDSDGCSLVQFCSAIDTSMDHGRQICNRSDWKNDEPLEGKGDCEAIKCRLSDCFTHFIFNYFAYQSGCVFRSERAPKA